MVAALKNDESRLVMPSALRRRSLLLLQGLVAEAVRRGHEVRKTRSSFYPREDGVDIAVDGFTYTVTVRQEFPESTDQKRSACLVLEFAHDLTDRPGGWRDRKTRTLEEVMDVILGESEARAVEDARRRQDEQWARAEREVRWQAAMDVAEEQAVREQLAQVLREEAGCWQEAIVLSAYCTALERRIASRTVLRTSRLWTRPAAGCSGLENT
ncbi:hypothetical protein [Streptomyces sviceus]|uniref:hypothetical protein n=1 Tax=Streptomyces sviceus TaxID=285530 RepID=UPI0036C669A2